MDLEVLNKKLSSYRTVRGQIRNVSDELLMEVLSAWEQWTGPTGGFSTAIGVSRKGISSIIGKAKKLKREGHFPVEEFKEIKVESSGVISYIILSPHMFKFLESDKLNSLTQEVFVDLEVLKRKISTFRGEGGRIRITSDELLIEILLAWEQWTGPAQGFYGGIGVSSNGMGSIIGRAKKLKREGFPLEAFKEIKLKGAESAVSTGFGPCSGIEVGWDNGKLIRFQQVDQLVDFLKKVV